MEGNTISKPIGKVVSVNRSFQRGLQKKPVGYGYFKLGVGMAGDAHSNPAEPELQVSLLAHEDYPSSEKKIPLGMFGENITTQGINISSLGIGTQLYIGREVLLQIGQIGKDCHEENKNKGMTEQCHISTHGVFAYVRAEGEVSEGDEIRIIKPDL